MYLICAIILIGHRCSHFAISVDVWPSSEEKSNGSAKPYSCGVFFIYHSLLIIIPCFGNFVNGKGTKNYSKNAEFLVAILCKTYTTALADFSFFLRAIFRGEMKKRPLPKLLMLQQRAFPLHYTKNLN